MHPNTGTHSRKFGVRLRHCNFIDSVQAHAAERKEDCEWVREVNLRLSGVFNLVAAEGRYQQVVGSTKPIDGSGQRGEKTGKRLQPSKSCVTLQVQYMMNASIHYKNCRKRFLT